MISASHSMRLAELTGESASLAVLDDADVVYVGRVPVRRIMSINVQIGTRVPVHATSMGRVLLAWAPPTVVDEIVAGRPLESFTSRTLTDPDAFRADLGRVRAQGWSVVSEELEPGLLSASAPVRDRSGHVVAALASSTSVGRAGADQLESTTVPLLVDIAERISAELAVGHPAQRRTRGASPPGSAS